jgi:hypothetical protein
MLIFEFINTSFKMLLGSIYKSEKAVKLIWLSI